MLRNPRHELFARLVAAGKPATRAYIEVGFAEKGAEQSACRLLKKPEVEKRVREVQAEIGAKLVKANIRELDARILALDARWELAHQLSMETLKSGKPNVALLREAREMEAWASKDLGQYVEKHEVGGTIIERLNAARERLRESES